MAPVALNLGLAYRRLAWPTHPSSKTNEKTGVFMHDTLSIKKTWVTLC